MALNDKDATLGGTKAVDLHPGVANPTASSTHADPLAANYVTDPTTAERGAGAGAGFAGDRDARRNLSRAAGVVEGRPGIIESANIDPLNADSDTDDGWANASSAPRTGAGVKETAAAYAASAAGLASSAAGMAAGAAQLAYGHAAGDEAAKRAGKEAVWGKE